MSKKEKKQYACQECGNITNKWSGKCESCGAWNSIEEHVSSANITYLNKKGFSGKKLALKSFEVDEQSKAVRRRTGIDEFDHVCGGGLVQGSTILIGGEPGIGKSTILLQVISEMANLYKDDLFLYVSGEEAEDQISLRAERLGLSNSPVKLVSATNVNDILETIQGPDLPAFLIIDSIQTLYHPSLESAPGTVSQLRACTSELIQYCKQNQITLFLVGHVTKEGQIAGPKLVEHMVDTVLYFEGDHMHHFRLLRARKNRYGPADEVGVFEMTGFGLQEVKNPSTLFLPERDEASDQDMSGTVIFVGMEGTRPILLEIQALVGPQTPMQPRRNVVGWDYGRLSMLLAVLETKCHVRLAQRDVFLNVAGGIKIQEPAADLAVAAAILSCLSKQSFGHEICFFGEVGLSGEVRRVSHIETRVKEVQRLGFEKLYLPKIQQKTINNKHIAIHAVSNLQSLVRDLLKS